MIVKLYIIQIRHEGVYGVFESLDKAIESAKNAEQYGDDYDIYEFELNSTSYRVIGSVYEGIYYPEAD